MAVLLLADPSFATTARLVAAAAMLGPVDVLATEAAPANIAGVAKVLIADVPPSAELLAHLSEPYSHIVAGAGTTGRDLVPRLAGKLDLMPVTDVVEILGPNRFVRPIYAGNATQTVSSSQPRHLLTIRASAFRPAAAGNNAPVEMVGLPEGLPKPNVISEERTTSDRPELGTAQIVVSGGIAVGSAEGFKLIETLAETLGAAVGATRAAVDAGYAPNEWQVGQTGKIIAPDLYIAIGISGALQHLAGIQGAKRIAAINTDPEAPLMKLADYAVVADLRTAVPALIAELERLGVKR
jgi:electron transfer flavoprotein alpha subunit